jgi:hypothetical protein
MNRANRSQGRFAAGFSRLAISTALVPPKANEFDIAWRSPGTARAVPARSSARPDQLLEVGGGRHLATGQRLQRHHQFHGATGTQQMPVDGLGRTDRHPFSPKTVCSDSASARSPAWVAVPWAFT